MESIYEKLDFKESFVEQRSKMIQNILGNFEESDQTCVDQSYEKENITSYLQKALTEHSVILKERFSANENTVDVSKMYILLFENNTCIIGCKKQHLYGYGAEHYYYTLEDAITEKGGEICRFDSEELLHRDLAVTEISGMKALVFKADKIIPYRFISRVQTCVVEVAISKYLRRNFMMMPSLIAEVLGSSFDGQQKLSHKNNMQTSFNESN